MKALALIALAVVAGAMAVGCSGGSDSSGSSTSTSKPISAPQGGAKIPAASSSGGAPAQQMQAKVKK